MPVDGGGKEFQHIPADGFHHRLCIPLISSATNGAALAEFRVGSAASLRRRSRKVNLAFPNVNMQGFMSVRIYVMYSTCTDEQYCLANRDLSFVSHGSSILICHSRSLHFPNAALSQ